LRSEAVYWEVHYHNPERTAPDECIVCDDSIAVRLYGLLGLLVQLEAVGGLQFVFFFGRAFGLFEQVSSRRLKNRCVRERVSPDITFST
jgi:hypothetical protein